MGRAKPTLVAALLAILPAVCGASPAGDAAADEGLLLLANRDDDDRDGAADADDDTVNGVTDVRDLGLVTLPVADGVTALRLDAAGAPLRFFHRDGASWRHLGLGRGELPVAAGADEVTIGVEATSWAGMPATWSGTAAVRVTGVTATGATLREIPVRVAPVRLRPATAAVGEMFVASGRYDNAAFIDRLRTILDPLDVPLAVHPSRSWQEMWMQDTMEMGIAASGSNSMHVVLAGLRGADSFPPTLLGPDTAVAEVAGPRPLAGGDAWADWYGNLEASVPTAGHPQGRVIHGRNRLTGCTFHPEVVAFLAAQRIQPPIWIDTSWLLIKHVDEIVSFLPGKDGRGAIVVPDPVAGLALLDDGGDAAVATRRREANARIAREIEMLLRGGKAPARAGSSDPADDDDGNAAPGLLALVGLRDDRVIRLPVAFDVPAAGLLPDGTVTDASSLWSNPVNAVFVNGTVICGSSGMPDAALAACRERFLAAGAERVEFIDDGCYQKHHGNVHCATNTRRHDVAAGREIPAVGPRPASGAAVSGTSPAGR